jgi:hypothetical protein
MNKDDGPSDATKRMVRILGCKWVPHNRWSPKPSSPTGDPSNG